MPSITPGNRPADYNRRDLAGKPPESVVLMVRMSGEAACAI
jgi:hypothetical protein